MFDKGCCTLCALVCHKGHEVAYSRSSSFFCDCGAEVASAGEQNRVVCKCISPLSQEEADNLWREERAKNFLFSSPKAKDSNKEVLHVIKGEADRPMELFVDVASQFRKESTIAIETIKAAASDNSWVLTVFGLINDQPHPDSSYEWAFDGRVDAPIQPISWDSIASGHLERSGKVLELARLENSRIVPIRAARAGSFNVKLSLDSTTDRVKRTTLGRHGIVRSVVVVDSRGRLIIAEPSSLSFCSFLPVVNTRYVDDPLTTQIGRSQLSFVASHPVAFNIVGMQLCKENERHLVIWGTSEACVMVLKENWNGVERTSDLEIDLDPHECDSDCLLRCDWVPASQTLVSLTCGAFVKIYNMRVTQSDEVIVSHLSYNVGYEAVIKDSAWTSLPFASQRRKCDPCRRKLSLFLLMDTGRLHEMQPQLDSQGMLDCHGSFYVERSSRCVDIPTAGVRPYEGVSVGKAGSCTRSMGEGCSLCFLPLSNMLLYKCISSCVVALPFDESGEIKGSFELLPNRIDSEILGNSTDAYNITGPFTHWKEMGEVDGGVRLVCTGKSSRTNQPKILTLLVNEKSVRVREITWAAGGSVGLGLSLSSSFEGLAVFSGPSLSKDSRFEELLYFCVVTSNGSILVYGEEGSESSQGNERSVALISCGEVAQKGLPKPQIAVTIFEDLLNVSSVDEVRFTGDGIGR